MTLSRDDILKRPDLVSVDVPEWGGEVLLRPLSAKASMAIIGDDQPQSAVAAKLIVASLVDASGERLFSDDDVTIVEDLAAKAVLGLSREIMRLNGFGRDDIERTVGESEPSQDGGSSTA